MIASKVHYKADCERQTIVLPPTQCGKRQSFGRDEPSRYYVIDQRILKPWFRRQGITSRVKADKQDLALHKPNPCGTRID
jgi:hypothetical protein